LRSGISASAFTAMVAGWPGARGIVDQTVDPRFATGCCGSSCEATSIAALAALAATGGRATGFCAKAIVALASAKHNAIGIDHKNLTMIGPRVMASKASGIETRPEGEKSLR
jgi:hypothetical protein